MRIINLYRYERETGRISVSPVKPDGEYTELVRLIADEGKILVKGNVETSCVDTESAEGWEEVDAPEEKDDITE